MNAILIGAEKGGGGGGGVSTDISKFPPFVYFSKRIKNDYFTFKREKSYLAKEFNLHGPRNRCRVRFRII